MVARATCLFTGASGTAPDGGVRFPSEFSVTTGTFALGQVLNFGSLANIANYHGKLHPLHGIVLAGNEPPANLEVLAHQIQHGLGPNPTMLDHHQMFYMLANVHHQIATSEVLPPLDHF